MPETHFAPKWETDFRNRETHFQNWETHFRTPKNSLFGVSQSVLCYLLHKLTCTVQEKAKYWLKSIQKGPNSFQNVKNHSKKVKIIFEKQKLISKSQKLISAAFHMSGLDWIAHKKKPANIMPFMLQEFAYVVIIWIKLFHAQPLVQLWSLATMGYSYLCCKLSIKTDRASPSNRSLAGQTIRSALVMYSLKRLEPELFKAELQNWSWACPFEKSRT